MMESIGGNRLPSRHRSPPSSDRLLEMINAPPSSYATSGPPVEFSELEIFSSPSGSSSPSNVDPSLSPRLTPSPSSQNNGHKNHGILAALNEESKIGSRSSTRPVFNHRASTSASLSSSSSTSPAASLSSRIMIPKRPPTLPNADRMRFHHQSAPVNVPVIPRRKTMELSEILFEEKEGEEEEDNVERLPPHEVLAARNSPMLAFSVLEGAGRTLKGRDLRQVRNAIWRKTGFLD